MGKSRSEVQTQTFEYDFAGNAGANGLIGIHELPIYPPNQSLFINGFIFCKTALVGVGAELDFGNGNGNFHTGTTLPIADFGLGVNIVLNQIAVNSPDTNSYIAMGGLPLTITISTANITAGIILFTVNYQSFDPAV